MSKEVILTGIRANNDLTIGNYFGAILPMIDMAKHQSEKYQINMFVPDLHSFTTPIDHSKLQEQIMHNLRIFVAAGLPLDNTDIHIYRQSYIPAHSELTWILDCFTGFGEMNKMTQFTEKSRGIYRRNAEEYNKKFVGEAFQFDEMKKQQSEEFERIAASVSVGLFNYPVLMASDILLYNTTYVPVGDDQTQHLEYTRNVAERMNKRFGDLFVVPKPVKEQHKFFGKDQGLRIKDLQDPSKKMSKSDDTGKGVIFLGDSPDEAAKKIMSAATDSVGSINLDWDNQPGISNLLTILGLFTDRSATEVEEDWKGKSSYGDLKKAVAEATRSFLEGLQSRLAQVDDPELLSKLESSEATMREIADKNLLKVQKAVGLRA